MANKFVYVQNKLNGELALVHERVLRNPHLAKNLEVVESEDGKTVVEESPAQDVSDTSDVRDYTAPEDYRSPEVYSVNKEME